MIIGRPATSTTTVFKPACFIRVTTCTSAASRESVLGRLTQLVPPTGVGMSPHPSEYGVSPMTAMPTVAPLPVADPSSA